jgi:diguanylate cyclase (GGDEF)-like protein
MTRFSRRRLLSPSSVSVVVGAALFAVWVLSGIGDPHQRQVIGDAVPLAFGLAAITAAWRASTRPGVEAAARRTWRRLAVGWCFWWVGDITWFIYEVLLRQHPFPSFADVGYLAFYPCVAWALLSFPSSARQRGDWLKATLDAVTVLLCASLAIWYLVVGPTIHDNPAGRLATALNLAYPVGDLLLLFGIVVALMRRTGGGAVLRLLLTGVGALVVADVAFARLSLSGGYGGLGWPDVFWAGAQCLFVLAARASMPAGRAAGAERQRLIRPSTEPLTKLPYLAVGMAYLLVLLVGHGQAAYPLNGLILGAAAITTVVLIRQVTVIAENGRLMSQLHQLASVDALTGIPNRRAFLEEAEQLFDGSRQTGGRLSILMVDVDHFKSVNDTYGHGAGDKVLSLIAACVKSQLRDADLVGRYGGDELVIALADCSPSSAAEVAERIRTVAAATPVVTENNVVSVTLSIGIASADECQNMLTLLARADLALYDAKRAGRSCVREFSRSNRRQSEMTNA